jgi:hypothetical protein
VKADEAKKVIEMAGVFKTLSAKIEYSRHHGVDYERAVKYAKHVQDMDDLLSNTRTAIGNNLNGPVALLPAPTRIQEGNLEKQTDEGEGRRYVQMMTTSGSGEYLIRIRVVGISDQRFRYFVQKGGCPLCSTCTHSIDMCPSLPDEYRALFSIIKKA